MPTQTDRYFADQTTFSTVIFKKIWYFFYKLDAVSYLKRLIDPRPHKKEKLQVLILHQMRINMQINLAWIIMFNSPDEHGVGKLFYRSTNFIVDHINDGQDDIKSTLVQVTTWRWICDFSVIKYSFTKQFVRNSYFSLNLEIIAVIEGSIKTWFHSCQGNCIERISSF